MIFDSDKGGDVGNTKILAVWVDFGNFGYEYFLVMTEKIICWGNFSTFFIHLYLKASKIVGFSN